MGILGVGPLEVVVVVILALIILGPDDLVKTGFLLGRWLRQLMNSSIWRGLISVGAYIKDLPGKLMEVAEIDEIRSQLNESVKPLKDVGKDLLEEDRKINQTLQSESPSQTAQPPTSTNAKSAYSAWINPELNESQSTPVEPSPDPQPEAKSPSAPSADKVREAIHSQQTIHPPLRRDEIILLSAEPDDEDFDN